ncbi:DHA2 family efflux MFS transporter permease subunit [Heliobacterium gestii]|uniref:DHA2 family efflux MFS transporter permease subunit n=1 Tax=Heliomicrobium gestii TaxID=2699 RepID=A0A845L5C7_HELGE|nr:MDR family MFS transporter [Heliomicrobium gestii]MBM7865561.1 EmrB/QacA subfamily drug resistance transporter [Heliomicrobium gestii]MZP41812.1 DHA2 family efflux MFS transporter permease subunit [Heliomicrobium gestii]
MNKNRTLLLIGLFLAMFFGALDQTVTSTAMPTIIAQLGGFPLMAWLATAYMLSSTIVVPIAGKLADQFGRKPVYLFGLGLFMAASALCGLAGSMERLILYRALQGIGGGVMMPMSLIIIGDIFTGEERAKFQGVFGGIFGLSSIIGPQIGGWFVDHLAWQWVFYINLPFGLLAALFIALGLRDERIRGKAPIDYNGIATFTIAMVSLLLALSLGGTEYPWLSWQIAGLFAGFAVFLLLFLRAEKRAEEPLLSLSLFRNRSYVLLNLIGFFMTMGMFGAIMFMPLFMQGVVGVTASGAGTTMTPMMLSMIVASTLGGRALLRLGVKPQVLGGLLIMMAGLLLVTTLGVGATRWTASLYLVIIGFGLGLVMPVLTIALQEIFPRHLLGAVTASGQFFRSIGGTFGVALFGAVMNQVSGQSLRQDLLPLLAQAPAVTRPVVEPIRSLLETNPQSLYSMLLQGDVMARIPESFRVLIEPVIKSSLAASIHAVFWTAAGATVLSFLTTLFLPTIRISQAATGKGRDIAGEAERQASAEPALEKGPR